MSMFFPPHRKPVRERRFLIRTFLQLVPQACAAKRAPTYSERLDKLRIFADEAAEELPQVFYRELNGGIILSPITKAHPQSDPKKPLLVLGEYRNSPQMGRSIVLYGGSILHSYGIYRTKS